MEDTKYGVEKYTPWMIGPEFWQALGIHFENNPQIFKEESNQQ